MAGFRWSFSVLGAALTLACSGGMGDTAAGSTSGAGTTGVTETLTTGDGKPTSGGSTSTTTGDGASGTTCDSASCEPACDVFAQDCPEGQKCAPFYSEGASWWDATRCVPVTGDRQTGEPCTASDGGRSGLDDCAKGAYCWNVDAQGEGLCIEMCGGSIDAPVCKVETTSCVRVMENVMHVCIADCDPLTPDCPADDVCIFDGDTFLCVLDGEPQGGVFEECFTLNGCDYGLLCSSPSWAAECDPEVDGCCLPVCDLEDPQVACPGAGQSCVSPYEPGKAPPKFAHLGVCRIPG